MLFFLFMCRITYPCFYVVWTEIFWLSRRTLLLLFSSYFVGYHILFLNRWQIFYVCWWFGLFHLLNGVIQDIEHLFILRRHTLIVFYHVPQKLIKFFSLFVIGNLSLYYPISNFFETYIFKRLFIDKIRFNNGFLSRIRIFSLQFR